MYAERRILEAVAGCPYAELHATIGLRDLQEDVTNFEEKEKKSPGTGLRYTRLDVGEEGLGDTDPDEVFSFVPYEKGFLFLRRIEDAVSIVTCDPTLSPCWWCSPSIC